MWKRRTGELRFPPSHPLQLYQAYFPVCDSVLWTGTGATAAAEATVSDNPAAQRGLRRRFACLSQRPPTRSGERSNSSTFRRYAVVLKSFSHKTEFSEVNSVSYGILTQQQCFGKQMQIFFFFNKVTLYKREPLFSKMCHKTLLYLKGHVDQNVMTWEHSDMFPLLDELLFKMGRTISPPQHLKIGHKWLTSVTQKQPGLRRN